MTWYQIVPAVIVTIVTSVFCHPQCNIDSSDFDEIRQTPCFVDKTMMLTEVFKGPKVKFITAPRRFGKTTNLDMVRRFIQLNVDDEGKQVNVRKSVNYKLFRNNSLNIFQHKTVYRKHFGKYPVLLIDYGPLKYISSYENMLEQFRTVLLNSFDPHTYLIENPELWNEEDTKEQFLRYVHPTHHLTLKSAAVRYGFPFLIKLLQKHFNKSVYILIDDYDSYVESLVFTKVPDIDIIYTYIQSINNNLLSDSDSVSGILIFGVLQILNNERVTNYNFLGNHPFSVYFGFTHDDVATIIVPNLSGGGSNQTEMKLQELVKYYNGYHIRSSKQTRLFSQWSLLNHLCNGVTESHLRSRREFSESFKSTLNIPDIAKSLEKIIMGSPFEMNASYVFTSDDIFKLNKLVTKRKVKNKAVRLLYFNYLYQLGYLTNTGTDEEQLKCVFPNTEVLNEIKSLLNKFSINM